MRLYIILVLLNALSFGSYAMQDSVATLRDTTVRKYRPRQQQFGLLDSVAAADAVRQQFVSDSLAMLFIQKPDPHRKNQFVEEMMSTQVYKGYGFLDIKPRDGKSLGMGQARKTRDNWAIGVILFLLLYTAFLRIALSKDISNIFQSFYSKSSSASPADEDSVPISFRAFVGLLVLFGLTFGLFLYQLSNWYHVYNPLGGFLLFIALSGVAVLLLGLKLVLLKFIGFVFAISEVVDRYIAILCFTYFSITFVILPVTVCMSLLTAQLVPVILLMAMVLAGAILVWQYLRNSIIIISNFRFSKFYLFVVSLCPRNLPYFNFDKGT
jgi:hypothetical protein